MLRLLGFVFSLSFIASEARADEASVVVAPTADDAIVIEAGNVACHVTEHGGIDADDARTATDLLCGALAERGAPAARYDVRFGRLDGDVVVTATRPGTKTSRRIILGSLREMPVAAPRLAQSIVADETVSQTQASDNVVSPETRRPYMKNGTSGAYLGLIGATTSTGGGASGGFELGVDYRLKRLGIGGHARAGGIGSGDAKLSFASLDVGASIQPWDSDAAPFLGSGIVLGYYDADRRTGSGLGTFVELGVDMLRSSRMGLRASVRADLPFFALESRYVVPLTFNFGLAFR